MRLPPHVDVHVKVAALGTGVVKQLDFDERKAMKMKALMEQQLG
jgi:hypothetical protein